MKDCHIESEGLSKVTSSYMHCKNNSISKTAQQFLKDVTTDGNRK